MNTKFQCRPTSALTTLSAAAGTKTRALQAGLIAATLLTLSTLAAPAQADTYPGETRRDRAELRRDYRELAGDRADYRHAQARGDIAGMLRERMEIRHDWREIRRDQAELRHDLHERRQDRHEARHAHWRSGVAGSGNHGLHRGWQIGRGNPHRG